MEWGNDDGEMAGGCKAWLVASPFQNSSTTSLLGRYCYPDLMKTRFVPELFKPCERDWNSMRGDDRCRFCEHCQLHVHNLSAMTPREQADLLKKSDERVCVAYFAAADSVPVRPRTWLLLQRLRAPFAALAAS